MEEKLPKARFETVKTHDEERGVRTTKYYLTIRFMPAVYMTKELPGDVTPEEAMAATVKEAKSRGLRCCLSTSDNINYFIDAEGHLENTSTGPRPHMVVSGNSFRMAVEEDE